jgi:hypothetical protein
MAQSFANYLRYASGPEAAFLGRFVCAACDLDFLCAGLEKIGPDMAIPLSVIGRASTDTGSWADARQADAGDMNAFVKRAGALAEIETFEVRLPERALTADCCRDLRGFTDADVFVELPWAQELYDGLALVADMDWINAKARLTGSTAAAYPSSEQVADFLHGCISLDLVFKLTGGLHHPFPTSDSLTGAKMHGFINVLVAAAMAYENDLSRKELCELLNDSGPASFEFGEKGISWRGEVIGLARIVEVREMFVSIGTCSIDEPLVELGALGLASA